MFQLDECNDKSPHRILNGTITINIIIIIITASAVIKFCFFLFYNQQAKYLPQLCNGQSIFFHAPYNPIRLQAEFNESKPIVTKLSCL
jgi:hypothetical protein